MRTIKLKSLSLFNFKGIRNLTLDFTNAETWIYGENGTGKTTVCDAFSWLLFGKDSKGKSDSNFNIKTLDENGKPKIGRDGKAMQKWVKVYEPTFQIGYKGLIQLALRSGQYRTINADVVYDGELRKVNRLTGEIAFDGERKSDKVIGYFCYFELINGFAKTLYMTTEQMATHAKRYSKALKNDEKATVEHLLSLANLPVSPDSTAVGWMGNFHGMAIKTVIRNLLSKYGYLSIEMQNAIASDYEGEYTDVRDNLIQDNANKQVLDMTDATYEEVATESNANPNAANEPDY